MSTEIKDKTDYLSGNLYVTDDKIEVVLNLWASSDNYKYGQMNMVINNRNKAIIFSYYNSADPELSDNDTMNSIIPIHFSIDKPKDWKSDDAVRVMYVNEADPKSFHELTPYFETRLHKFEYQNINEEGHNKFNFDWNMLHPDNKVTDVSFKEEPSRIPRFTKRDGIFTLMKR